MEELRSCDHCHENIVHEHNEDFAGISKSFCCNGCLTVYQILNSNGLSNYYKLKDPNDYQGRPEYTKELYDYLDEAEFKSKYIKNTNGTYTFKFFVEGVHCVACLWLLEKLSLICDGVRSSQLNMASSILRVELSEGASLAKVAQKLASIGYKPHPILKESDQEQFAKEEDRKSLIKIGIAFAAAGNIMLYTFAIYTGAEGIFKNYFNLFSFICSIPVIGFCAIPFYQNAWNSIKLKELSIDIPIVIALIVGFFMGVYSFLFDKEYFYFDTLAILVFLLLFARFILKKAQKKSLDADDLSSFFSNKSAHRLDDRGGEEVLTKFLQLGDQVLVKAGEMVPIDGVVVSGNSYINNSLLTGEVIPEKVKKQSHVYMGAKNLGSEIIINVTSLFEESRLGKIIDEIERGWKSESRISLITDKISKNFVSLVFSLAVIFFIYFSVTSDIETAFIRTLTLLIITCPCALALTTPLALILGLSRMAKLGVLVKNEHVIEKLASAKNIFLDKTGTLTDGEFTVTNVDNLGEQSIDYRIIYSLENQSHHPIAKSLVEYLKQNKLAAPKDLSIELSEFKEIPGVGVSGFYQNIFYEVRSLKKEDRGADNGFSSLVGFYQNKNLLVIFKLEDKLREGVVAAINGFKKEGVTPHILSGDIKQSVLNTASKLNIDEGKIFYEKSPEEKKKLVLNKAQSIMVGDGGNDAIALKSAHVGVAVRGSVEVSLRAADVYLSKSGVSHVLNLIKASKLVMNIIYRNLGFSFCYNLVGIYLAFTGQVTPLVAAVLMPLSSITVLFSTLGSIRGIKKVIL